MRWVRAAIFCILSVALVSSVASSPVLECDETSPGKPLTKCLRRVLRDPSPRDSATELQDLLAERPELALQGLEVLVALHASELEQDPSVGAWIADLAGQALAATDRWEESAERFDRAVAIDDGTTRLTWLHEGELAWKSGLDVGTGLLERVADAHHHAGDDAAARRLLERARLLGSASTPDWAGPVEPPTTTKLRAEPWRMALPPIELKIFGGQRLDLVEDASGKVVVLDFWASWCKPCAEELPRLQELFDENEERGLLIVAVNAREAPSVAVTFAMELGLTMPVAQYDGALHGAFQVEALPTVIVADRAGRIRARWDGYDEVVGQRLSDLVLRLLDEEGDTRRDLAEVARGADRFEARWLRETASEIDDVAWVPGPDGGVLAASGKTVVRYGADGAALEVWQRVPSIRRISTSAPAENGVVSGLGFRPGGGVVVPFRVPGGGFSSVPTEFPVFDAAPLSGDSFVLASDIGLARISAGSIEMLTRGQGRVSGVRTLREDGDLRIVALGSDGVLRFFDGEGRAERTVTVPRESWGLLSDGRSGVGVAPIGATAHAVGTFLRNGETAAAVATYAGQLVLVDVATGREVYRATWPGIGALAAGDLDGDGVDELLVGAGSRIVALGRPVSSVDSVTPTH